MNILQKNNGGELQVSEEVNWAAFAFNEKDQGNCGSCGEHGPIKAIEAALRIRVNDPNLQVDYSEQDLMACSGSSCEQGSIMENVMNRLMVGVASEECCTYKARTTTCGEGRCAEWRKTGIKIKSWKSLTNWEEMKTAMRKRPVVGLMAVHQSFMNYQDGLYHSLGLTDPIVGYHCIANFGFRVGFSGVDDYILIQNSWKGWGFKINGIGGFCKLRADDSEIAKEMIIFELDGEIPPEPEPEPTPSPCKIGNGFAKIINFFCWLSHREGRYYYMNPPNCCT